MHIREHQDHFWIEFENGVSVEIRLDGRTFGGIGRVKCGRYVLRSAELPIMPLIVSVDGYEVCRLELDEMEQLDEALVITLRPYVRLQGRVEPRGAGGDERWNVASWKQELLRDRGGKLWLRLAEVNHLVGDMELRGFSYGYRFRSRKYKPSRIHDRATWELKGHATGNSFWMRGQSGPPRWTIRSKADAFSTTWFSGDQPSRQFLPFFTELQGFTYQFDRQCVLVTAFEKPFHCLSLFQKNAAAGHIIHWHQLCGAASTCGGCLDFPALEVMCAEQGSKSEVERLNRYEAVRSALSERYCGATGLQADRAMCVGRLIHEPSARRANLKRGIGALADAGCAEVLLSIPIGKQTRVSGKASPDAAGTGLYEKSLERVRRIAGLAHECGMQVGAFLSPAILWPDSPADGARESAPEEALPARASAQPQRRLPRLIQGLKKELPLDAFYLDGLAVVPHLYAGGVAPGGTSRAAFEAQLALQRALQLSGFRCGGNRGGTFGVSAAPVPYSLVRNNELLYRDTVMPFPYEEVRAAGDDPHDAYFRGYAGRLCYGVSFDCSDESGGGLDEWWDAQYVVVNKAYCAVSDHMCDAQLLRRGHGILWSRPGGDARVLWVYEDFAWRVGQHARVYDVMAQRAISLENNTFVAEPRRVYLIQDARDP